MNNEREVRRKTERRPIAVRRVGRPRLRWDEVRSDLGKLWIQNWSKMATDIEAWKRIIE
jgi:hypothetical protein